MMSFKPQSRTLVVGDTAVRFYIVEGGNSFLPPLVLLHGWRSEARTWAEIARKLADKGFTLYLVDLPGFGHSDLPGGQWGVEEYSEVVRILLEKLGLLKPVLIGHSFGGQIAINLAASAPDLLERLVLVDAAGVREEKPGIKIKKKIARILSPLFSPSFMRPLKERIYRMLGAEDYLARPELREIFLNAIRTDLTHEMQKIQHDTLLVWGGQDRATPLSQAQVMERVVPHSKLIIYDDAGHYSFLDEPDRFVLDVSEFAHHGFSSDEKSS